MTEVKHEKGSRTIRGSYYRSPGQRENSVEEMFLQRKQLVKMLGYQSWGEAQEAEPGKSTGSSSGLE